MKIVFDEFGAFLGLKHNRYIIKNKGIKTEVLSSDVEQINILNSGMSISISALKLAITLGESQCR
jgi:CRISPR/Cas system-associated endonuclease Cas1